jgi:hypothetical protein
MTFGRRGLGGTIGSGADECAVCDRRAMHGAELLLDAVCAEHRGSFPGSTGDWGSDVYRQCGGGEVFLRERVDRRRWLATMCVVVGVILLAR